jgi:hypothetical protein
MSPWTTEWISASEEVTTTCLYQTFIAVMNPVFSNFAVRTKVGFHLITVLNVVAKIIATPRNTKSFVAFFKINTFNLLQILAPNNI